MGSLAQASITLLQNLLVPEGQSCCLQSILVFQETFIFMYWCQATECLEGDNLGFSLAQLTVPRNHMKQVKSVIPSY